MLEQLVHQVRWQDVVDVAVLTFVLYRLYVWMRGTVALQVLAGILVLGAAAVAANEVGLMLTGYLLQALGAVATLVVVVIFRDEIRRGLGRVNPVRWWRERRAGPAGRATSSTARVVADAAFALARRRIGALIVLPASDPIDEHLTGGCPLDATPSAALFEAIFHTGSPIHDGATVVQAGRVRVAGAFLPVSTSSSIPDHLGSRHRAAVGLSEECDAAVVVVSEERGAVSLVTAGAVTITPDADALTAGLIEAGPSGASALPGARPARRAYRVRDGAALLAILAGVLGAWWFMVGQPGTMVTRTVSVELRNVPEDLDADAPRPDRVAIELRGPRTRVENLGDEVEAWVDLDGAQAGRRRYPVRAATPPGIEVSEIAPATVTVRLRARE